MSAFRNSKHVWLRIATTPAGHHPRTLCSRSHHHVRGTNPAGASPVDNRVGAASPTPWSMTPTKCVIIPLPGTCAGGRGGTGIATTGLAERRQVVEVVIQREVIEYRIVSGTCACGRVQRSTFPVGIEAPVRYGGPGGSAFPERCHCSRNPKWGPSDFGCKKLGDGHGLRRPAFVLRPSRRALRSSRTLPRFPGLLPSPY